MVSNKKGTQIGPKEENVNEKFIEQSIKFINEKANETLYKGSIEIGDYLLKHFFNDDIDLASSRNPHKPKSYKALCKHKALMVPYSTLTIMVRVAAQERFFKRKNISTNRLSYTHKADLIRLNNNDKKIGLVHKCINESLSTRQLSQLINKERQEIAKLSKEAKDEAALKNILKIEQLLNRSVKSELITDIKKIRGMQNRKRKELKEKTSVLLQQMMKTTKECKKILHNIDKIEKEE